MPSFISNVRLTLGIDTVDELVAKTQKEGVSSEKIKKVSKKLEAWNHCIFNFTERNIYEVVVKIEFKAKAQNPEYEIISKAAKQCLKESKEISLYLKDEDIFSNVDDFLFLTSRRYHHYDYIMAHANNWQVDTSVRKNDEGKICYHDGTAVSEISGKRDQNGKQVRYVVTAEGPKPFYQRDGERRILPNTFKRNKRSTYRKNGELRQYEPGKFYVGVTSSQPTPHLAMTGHHTWLRLTDDQGRVAAVGKSPIKQPVRFVADFAPYFQGPDNHEREDNQDIIFEEVVEVTKEQYEELKKQIEDDMNNEDRNLYNTVKSNCADWALDLLQRAKIIEELDEPTRQSLKVNMFRTLLPSKINFIRDEVDSNPELAYLKFALEVITFPFRVILTPLSRGFLLLMGARIEKGDGVIELVVNVFHFFIDDVAHVTHPLRVRQYMANNLPVMTNACQEQQQKIIPIAQEAFVTNQTAAAYRNHPLEDTADVTFTYEVHPLERPDVLVDIDWEALMHCAVEAAKDWAAPAGPLHMAIQVEAS